MEMFAPGLPRAHAARLLMFRMVMAFMEMFVLLVTFMSVVVDAECLVFTFVGLPMTSLAAPIQLTVARALLESLRARSIAAASTRSPTGSMPTSFTS